MEQGNNTLRERLLALLPEPENLAAYREETAALIDKHKRALYWEKWSFETLCFCAAIVWIMASSGWAQKLDHNASATLHNIVILMFLAAVSTGLKYYFNRSKVDPLKEVKQVQLQVLELQASLQKKDDR
jgi:p-aminobenzoyl-glutamate transporter AbgT